jgi:hypothetical protein
VDGIHQNSDKWRGLVSKTLSALHRAAKSYKSFTHLLYTVVFEIYDT